MTELNISSPAQLVRSFYAAINARQLQALDAIVTPDFDPHIDRAGRGISAFRRVLHVYLSGFSGFRNRVEQILIDGNYVTARVRTCGVHTGSFLGHAPSNRPFAVPAIEVFRIAGSRIAERWSVFDTIAMLLQLGLYTPMEAAGAKAPAVPSPLETTSPPLPLPPMTVSAQAAPIGSLSYDNQLFSVLDSAGAMKVKF